MKKYEVEFNGGESRYGAEAVDYMMADIDGVELYAEAPAGETEEENYEALKAEILDQAKANGIPAESLKFWWD